MCSGIEAAKVAIQRGLTRPVAGGIGHHQWGIDRHHARTADVRLELSQQVVVIAGHADITELAAAVEYGHPGRAALAPGEVDSHEVHTPNRKLCACDHPRRDPQRAGQPVRQR